MLRSPLPFLLGLGILCGCHQAESPVELSQQDLQFADKDEYDAFFENCLDVLRRYGFDLDRVDKRAGFVSTFPQTSEHFFEFWRRDVATSHDWLEASLSTIRRRVEVEIPRPPEPGIEGSGQLVVRVIRERFSTPDRQYNSSGAAFLVYSQELPATTGRPIVPSRDERWYEDGRDGAMEQRLLGEMTGQAS